MFASCIRINPEYAHVEDKHTQYKIQELPENCNDVFADTSYHIYRLDKSILQQITKHTDKDYFLLYSVRMWCDADICKYADTIMNDFKQSDKVQLLLITEGNYTNKPYIKLFYKTNNYPYPTFLLDVYKYHQQRKEDNEMRFVSFIIDVWPESDLNTYTNVFILVDKEMNIVLSGNYDANARMLIKKIINED